jgi:hypothetical protein
MTQEDLDNDQAGFMSNLKPVNEKTAKVMEEFFKQPEGKGLPLESHRLMIVDEFGDLKEINNDSNT